MTELEPRAGEELERTLDRYVRLRLDPSPGQAKRARSAVMEAAWRQKLEGRHAAAALLAEDLEPSVSAASLTVLPASRGASGRAAQTHDPAPFAGWGPRRFGVSFAAAVLAGLMVGSSVFAASRAGGPLYGTRLALEELTLPTNAQARLEAELGLAQGRLAEIVEGVSKGDQQAAAAALTAYLATLDDLGDSTGGPAERALDAISKHQAVLEEVLGKAPEQARTGLENALLMSGKVIERLDAAAGPVGAGAGNGKGSGSGKGGAPGSAGGAGAGAGGGSGTGSGSGSSGGGGAGGNNGSGPGANSGNGPGSNSGNGPGTNNGGKPATTPRPAATPRPTPKPKPTKAPTPAPETTPTEQDSTPTDGASSPGDGPAGGNEH
ncbi:MAG TPA: DUF5667 domain-containing protein [Candidatus Limnocylindrales bacterium]|nr:DUF5667 domain-containing protein [Candidatus Limnocylindrales bacterium]